LEKSYCICNSSIESWDKTHGICQYDACKELNCEAIDATCKNIKNSFQESECVCNNALEIWDRQNKNCRINPCWALDCANNDATCNDKGNLEDSTCTCIDDFYNWDRETLSCQLDICEALECSNDHTSTCSNTGDFDTSTCICHDEMKLWDDIDKVCRLPPPEREERKDPASASVISSSFDNFRTAGEIRSLEIPLSMKNGMKNLLAKIFEVETSSRRKRAIDAVYDEIMEHGCHCIRMDVNDSGLGGTNHVDHMDRLCQLWIMQRRCLTLQGGSCHGVNIATSGFKYSVNYNTATNEIDCSPSANLHACLRDMCYVDASNAEYILGELQLDPDWTSVRGSVGTCPHCSNCQPPVGCAGTAPNVHTISAAEFDG